jgi:hypothetical protein
MTTKTTAPQQTYTLERKLCDANPGSEIPEAIWTVVFAFNAKSEENAKDKANDWARYHGKDLRDVRVRLSTYNEAQYNLHNEWVR